MVQYIALGCDCSVAYNLKRLELASESLPFDWIRCNNIKNITQILQDDFSDFVNLNFITVKPQNIRRFHGALADSSGDDGSIGDDEYKNISNCKSHYKIIHDKYKYIMPHEFSGDFIDWNIWREKYLRRIERFRKIVKNPNIQKIFVYLDITHESTIHISTFGEMEKVMREYTFGDIKFIKIKDYGVRENFNWKREWLDWKTVLLG